jgi:flagellar assembly protein FliH
MSTSYSKPDAVFLPEVEAFVYRDTLASQDSAFSVEAANGVPASGNRQTGRASHLGEEELARRLAEARAEGIREGTRQTEARLRDENLREKEHIAAAIREFQKQRSEYYVKVEAELVQLALAIAKKILHRESQVDRMVVAGLVKVMLERMNHGTNVVVRVHPGEVDNWRHDLRNLEGLQVVEDSTLQPSDCLLETELGIANLGLDAQLKEVEQGFFDLLARRPEA